MSFLEDVASNYTGPVVKGCQVAAWLIANPEVSTTDLVDAREQFSLKAVWLTIKKRGFEGSSELLSKHLRGECKCPVDSQTK